MSDYRIYCIDGDDKIASGDWIEAMDDEAAIAIVKELRDGYKCEIWNGSHLVARIDLRASREA